jgi:hypothetical protein
VRLAGVEGSLKLELWLVCQLSEGYAFAFKGGGVQDLSRRVVGSPEAQISVSFGEEISEGHSAIVMTVV